MSMRAIKWTVGSLLAAAGGYKLLLAARVSDFGLAIVLLVMAVEIGRRADMIEDIAKAIGLGAD